MAGEGTFTVSRLGAFGDGEPRLRFVFALEMAERDRALVLALREFLGYGSVGERPARREPWLATTCLTINSLTAHLAATIPFADRFLPPSAKRRQFDEWRARLVEYERKHPLTWGRGASPCAVPDCDLPVRGRGLCRRHYYQATGY